MSRTWPVVLLVLAAACGKEPGTDPVDPAGDAPNVDVPPEEPAPTDLVGITTQVDWTVSSDDLIDDGALPTSSFGYGYRAGAISAVDGATFIYTSPEYLGRTVSRVDAGGAPVASEFGWPIEDYRGSSDVLGSIAASPDGSLIVTAEAGENGIRVDAYDPLDGGASSLLWSQRFDQTMIDGAIRDVWFDANGTVLVAATGTENGQPVCRIARLDIDGSTLEDHARPGCAATSGAALPDGTFAWVDGTGTVSITDLTLESLSGSLVVPEYPSNCGVLPSVISAGPAGALLLQSRWTCSATGAADRVESQLVAINDGVVGDPVDLGGSIGTLVTLGLAVAWIHTDAYLDGVAPLQVRWLHPETFLPFGADVEIGTTSHFLDAACAADGDDAVSILVVEDRGTPFSLLHVSFEGIYE